MSEEGLNDKEMNDVNGGTDEIKKKLVEYPGDLDYRKSVPMYGINVPRKPVEIGLPLKPGKELPPNIKKLWMKKQKEDEEKE